jgi:hypothetical protein
MKLIAIRPDQKKVGIESIDPAKDELEQLQEIVSPPTAKHARGYLELGYTFPQQKNGTSLSLLVDEEGLINPRTEGGFYLKTPNGSSLVFSGRGIICCSDKDGNNITLPDSVDTDKIIQSITLMNPQGLALAYEAKRMEAYE